MQRLCVSSIQCVRHAGLHAVLTQCLLVIGAFVCQLVKKEGNIRCRHLFISFWGLSFPRVYPFLVLSACGALSRRRRTFMGSACCHDADDEADKRREAAYRENFMNGIQRFSEMKAKKAERRERLASNPELSAEERKQLMAIESRRPYSQTLAHAPDALDHYKEVTFGIDDNDSYFKPTVTAIVVRNPDGLVSPAAIADEDEEGQGGSSEQGHTSPPQPQQGSDDRCDARQGDALPEASSPLQEYLPNQVIDGDDEDDELSPMKRKGTFLFDATALQQSHKFATDLVPSGAEEQPSHQKGPQVAIEGLNATASNDDETRRRWERKESVFSVESRDLQAALSPESGHIDLACFAVLNKGGVSPMASLTELPSARGGRLNRSALRSPMSHSITSASGRKSVRFCEL